MELFDQDVNHTHEAHGLGKVMLVGKVFDDQWADSLAEESCKLLMLLKQ